MISVMHVQLVDPFGQQSAAEDPEAEERYSDSANFLKSHCPGIL